MMPEAGRVIDAARRLVESGRLEIHAEAEDLMDALEVLDAKLATAGHEPTREIQDRTWGDVVEGDEILSEKTQRWYEVTRSVANKGRIKVNIKGSPKPIERDRIDPVKVRRGVTGEAVDILEVLWSVQTKPTEVGTVEAGPMLNVEESGDE